ncbi:hypothetical protein CRE_18525 [Caenorhabditis remanei]|uniref:Uncharacterized protein n=1 Tax=Caenorhabditis remanei TaxID=31234 RepID=E3LLC5_CAERE|nr:hypothetical protein CRE_18525 [Caenorhabditis remanei]
MRKIAAVCCFLLVFLAENGVSGAVNDTLEMELESNITVVKLEHGLKFQAHSEFGLPENMTDLFNSTAADSEGVRIEIRQTIILRNRNKTGANNSTLPELLEHPRSRRSNKDDSSNSEESDHQKSHKKGHDHKKDHEKKDDDNDKEEGDNEKSKDNNQKAEDNNQKAEDNNEKSTEKDDKKEEDNKKTDDKEDDNKIDDTVHNSTTTSSNSTQSAGPDKTLQTFQRFPPEFPQQPATEQKFSWTVPTRHVPRQPTTRRVFVMYEDYELEKKTPKKEKDFDFDFDRRSP